MTSTKKSDLDHMGRAASLGCVVCRNLGYGESPAEAHHIGNGTMGKRASNYETIPLCHAHHRTGGHGVAVHAGRKAFEAKYGTERELLEQTRRELDGGL
ncbi:MAG: Ref family recombination enhancement nuclease [Hafnia sp.]